MKNPTKIPAAKKVGNSSNNDKDIIQKKKLSLKKPRGYRLSEEEALRIREIKRYAAQKLGPDLKSLNTTTADGKSKQIGIAQYEWDKKVPPFELVYGKDPAPHKRPIVPLGAGADSMLFGQIVKTILTEGYNPTERDFVHKLATSLDARFYVWDIEERIGSVLHDPVHYYDAPAALERVMKGWGTTTKSHKKREKDRERCHHVIHHLKTTFGRKRAVANSNHNNNNNNDKTNTPSSAADPTTMGGMGRSIVNPTTNSNLPPHVPGVVVQPALLTQQALFGRIQGLEQQTFQLIGHVHHLEAMQAQAMGRIQSLEQWNEQLVGRIRAMEGTETTTSGNNQVQDVTDEQNTTEEHDTPNETEETQETTTTRETNADDSCEHQPTEEKNVDNKA